MKFENFFKGFVTTLIGCALMILPVYDWFWEGERDWYQLGVPFVGGFALLYMRDKLSEFLSDFGKVLLNKFRGGPPAA
jgi:hypothetical protein